MRPIGEATASRHKRPMRRCKGEETRCSPEIHRNLSMLGALAAAMLASSAALAQISDDVVKIGVLTDMNGPASTPTGQGSVTAAQMAVDDFGGKVLGKPISVIVGDHQFKPDIGAGIARRWYDTEQVDLIVDVPVSAVGPCGAECRQRKEAAVHHAFDGHCGFPRQVLLALRHSVGVRHPRARGRHRAGSGQARRRQLVLHHRRLCVRPLAGTRCLGRDRQERRQGARLGAAALRHARPVVVHPAGAGLQGQDHRHRRRAAQQHERDQDRRRIRRPQGRPADGRPARR